MRFNTAIAKLIELTNRVTAVGAAGSPREVVEPLVLMVSPFAPHLAEELWRRLGHAGSLAYVDFPQADPALLVADSVTYPVQVNGKVRGRIEVPADADEATVRSAAVAEVAEALDGREPRKVIVVPGRMVSIVVYAPAPSGWRAVVCSGWCWWAIHRCGGVAPAERWMAHSFVNGRRNSAVELCLAGCA